MRLLRSPEGSGQLALELQLADVHGGARAWGIEIGAKRQGWYGSVAYVLARLDATLGDDTAARARYEEAATRDDRAGATVWAARDRRCLDPSGVRAPHE